MTLSNIIPVYYDFQSMFSCPSILDILCISEPSGKDHMENNECFIRNWFYHYFRHQKTQKIDPAAK